MGFRVAFAFSARITATGTATLTFQWERSDGVRSDVQTLRFAGPTGSQTASFEWVFHPGFSGRRQYAGWVVLRILSPVTMVSSRASFTLSCE
jgi:hypothetical protein